MANAEYKYRYVVCGDGGDGGVDAGGELGASEGMVELHK